MTEPIKPTLDELVAEADALYRYALPRVRNHHAAEDLVQETLIIAVKKFSEFQGRAALGTWLTGILRNKILEHLRHLQRHPESPPAPRKRPPGPTPPPNCSTERRLEERTQRRAGHPRHRSRAACRARRDPRGRPALPGPAALNLRRVFILREVEDCPTGEICAAAGVTRGSLAVLMHRARQLLRACLQKTWLNA